MNNTAAVRAARPVGIFRDRADGITEDEFRCCRGGQVICHSVHSGHLWI